MIGGYLSMLLSIDQILKLKTIIYSNKKLVFFKIILNLN